MIVRGLTPPVLPGWALPFAESIGEHAPFFQSELPAGRYALLRHAICLAAAFGEVSPDWVRLAAALGERRDDPGLPSLIARRLLNMSLKDLTSAVGPVMRLTPFLASVLRKTSEYLDASTYRQLASLEQQPGSSSLIHALLRSPPLTRRQIEIFLEVDVAFAHPVIVARLAETLDDIAKFNRIVADIERTCEPLAREALIQSLSARNRDGQSDVETVIREVVSNFFRIPTPTLRPGSRLEVIGRIPQLRAAGRRLRVCIGPLLSRRILQGEKLSVVICNETEAVALLQPLACETGRAFVVWEIGAGANRRMDAREQDRFIAHLRGDLEEEVLRMNGPRRRLYDAEQSDMEELFNLREDDL